MKNSVFLILIFLMASCTSEDNSTDAYYCLDTSIFFTIKDSNGNDLLNPNHPNAYISDSIKIYYLKENGEVEEIYNTNAADSRNFHIITPQESFVDYYAFLLHPNTFGENTITYIKWNNTDTDTVKTNYRYGKNYTICNKVWYNDVNVWTENIEQNTGRIFEIIKN